MNLRELEVFRAVIQEGSITEAANILRISQPAVSIALRNAEERLGIPLFRRSKRRIHPTPEALDLYPEVEGLFEKLSGIEKLARDLRDNRSGLLSVASTSTLTNAFIADAITRFREARPGVRVLLEVTHTQRTVELATAGQIGLGFIHAPMESPLLHFEKLTTAEMICILPRDHPLAGKASLGPKDLSRHPLVTNIRNSISPRVEEAFRRLGIERDFVVACNQTIAVYALVEAGAGIGLVEPWVGADLFPSLVRTRFRPRIEISPRALYARSQPLSRLAADFLDVVKEVVDRSAGRFALDGGPGTASARPRRAPNRRLNRPGTPPA